MPRLMMVVESGVTDGSPTSGTTSPNSRSRLGNGSDASSSGNSASSLLLLPQVTSASALVPQTRFPSADVPHTTLSSLSAVPQTMLSSLPTVPQPTFSQSSPPQSVP